MSSYVSVVPITLTRRVRQKVVVPGYQHMTTGGRELGTVSAHPDSTRSIPRRVITTMVGLSLAVLPVTFAFVGTTN